VEQPANTGKMTCEKGRTMLMYRRVTAVALAAVVLLTSVGCSKLREFQSATRNMGKVPSISQWTAETMTQAFTAINAKIPANPADYVEVLINELFVRVEAINPNKRENVDKFDYQNGSVDVGPVDASRNGPGAIEMSAFKGDLVKADLLAQVMSSAPKDSGVAENPVIEFVQVRKSVANDSAPRITVEVKGPRASKLLHYDLAGTLLDVNQG
jgi:hypothetical protein